MPITPKADQCLDFGWWRDDTGRSGLVTWVRNTGHLCYFGAGGLELLAVIVDEHAVRTLLDGWENHYPEGIGWVRQQVNPAACPTCHGEGWVTPNYDDDGPVDVACWCQILGNDQAG